MERVINKDEWDYKKFQAAAEMLTAYSKNGYEYRVEDVYLDYGQGWMWTTICRDGQWGGVQVLSPREWKNIIFAENVVELAQAVEDVRNNEFFTDK